MLEDEEDIMKWSVGKTRKPLEAAEQCSFDTLRKTYLLGSYYDVTNPAIIQSDASIEGLDVILLKDGKPVICVSRLLTKGTKEICCFGVSVLAIVFVCKKFDQYICGKEVAAETNHKPLEVITRTSLLMAPQMFPENVTVAEVV